MAFNEIEIVNQVNSKETFLEFIVVLRNDWAASQVCGNGVKPSLVHSSHGQENLDLGSFLEAMHAWTEDMGDRVPSQPSWRTFAEMLMAATVYE